MSRAAATYQHRRDCEAMAALGADVVIAVYGAHARRAPALVDALRGQLSTIEEGALTMAADAPVIRPKLHHVNLKTTRLQEMIDWYSTLVGARVHHQYELGAWISNDEANHRIALLAFPNF